MLAIHIGGKAVGRDLPVRAPRSSPRAFARAFARLIVLASLPVAAPVDSMKEEVCKPQSPRVCWFAPCFVSECSSSQIALRRLACPPSHLQQRDGGAGEVGDGVKDVAQFLLEKV